jgi:hypothetical protein
VGVALRRGVVEQAEGLRAPAQGQVAARDLRLRHGGDPQQLPDGRQVGLEVVIAEIRAVEIPPVPDYRPGRLEGQRVVDRRGPTHQLPGRANGGDGRDRLAKDLDFRELRVQDARHHQALPLEELGGLDELALLQDQDPLPGLGRELGGHERAARSRAHHDHVGLQNEAVGPVHDAGGLEAAPQGVVTHDAPPQDSHVLVGFLGHIEGGGVGEIRVGLRRIQHPRPRIAHGLPGHRLVRVYR